MPQIGDIRRAVDVGKVGNKRIWSACVDCGEERWVQLCVIKNKPKNLRCNKCATKLIKHPTGSQHPSWNGGRGYNGQYINIMLSTDDFFYPTANKSGRVMEHRLVMAKHLGRNLNSWEIVHHKGTKYPQGSTEDKQDNRIENLEIMTRGNHRAEHNKGYGDGYRRGFTDGQASQIKELRKELKLIQWQNSQLLEELRKIKSEA